MPTPTAGIVARYADGDAAGHAIERLSLHGVDAGRISLSDEGTNPADRPAQRRAQRRTDAGTGARLLRRLGTGGAIGLVAGAVLGAIVVTLVTSGGASAAIAGGLTGAAAGAGLGALTGLQSTPTMSTAWASTFGAAEGEDVTVAVEGPDELALLDIEEALGGTGAIEIRRVSDLDAR
jgi:hypothetical protein